MPDFDALIAGAGPAGSSTAIALAERGLRVAVVDRARFPRPKACAEYMNPEAMRILDRLGLLEPAQLSGAAAFWGMRLIAPGGDSVALDFQQSAGRSALGLSRHALDHLAVQRCRELGVEVFEGTRVRDVQRAGDRVIGLTVSQGQGTSREITGGVVVGADGHHSTVSRQLGLDRNVRWPRRIGLAAHFEGFPLADGLGEMHAGPGGYCGVAPQEDGRVNVAMVVDMRRFERRSGSVEDFFTGELRSYAGLRERTATAQRVTRVRGVGPLTRKVRRTSGDGFLLVGDAAGFFDPFTGEGIVDALQGGLLAADAISRALELGDVSAKSLASYERARRSSFTNKRRAAWLVQAFVTSPRLMDYAISRIARRPEIATALTGVFGDYQDAGLVLSPRFLWAALHP